LFKQTDDFYFAPWKPGAGIASAFPCNQLSRFDAIYLLSLSQWDRLCPVDDPNHAAVFQNRWGIDPARHPGLHLDLQPASGKSAQAISIMVRIPEEVHILMRPEGGWIDVETLWHELGHGLSAVYRSVAAGGGP
jgi:hypothetical protein